jgi:hypothetical protein
MDRNDTLKLLLAQLAEVVDRPEGDGGGAICLMAITAIEELEYQCRRPPRGDEPPA